MLGLVSQNFIIWRIPNLSPFSHPGLQHNAGVSKSAYSAFEEFQTYLPSVYQDNNTILRLRIKIVGHNFNIWRIPNLSPFSQPGLQHNAGFSESEYSAFEGFQTYLLSLNQVYSIMLG
jgi:hypothetical protein